MPNATFSDLGLSEKMVSTLTKKGYSHPTSVQSDVIPHILSNTQDMIIQSATGSGKTGAFGIPLVELIRSTKPGIQAVVLAPTRELAIQVNQELDTYKGQEKINVITVCGGQSITAQIRQIKSNKQPAIIVGTPGRVIDLLQKKVLNFSQIQYLVLDEVDEMLTMGFKEEVDTILSQTSDNRRSIVLSATLPKAIQNLLNTYLTDAKLIKVSHQEQRKDNIEQVYYPVHKKDKNQLLYRVIDEHSDFYGIVFCNTKRETEQIAQILNTSGYHAEFFHGDLSQAQREAALAKFKQRRTKILVVTDVAARGIDVKDVTHVVNISVPQNAEVYTHRIGRTGRAGQSGKSITFVQPTERHKFSLIEKKFNNSIRKADIPSVEAIIESKTAQFIETIGDVKPNKKLKHLTESLLESHDSLTLVEKLLTLVAKNQFNTHKYQEISTVNREDSGRRPFNKRGRSFKKRSNGDRPRDSWSFKKKRKR